MHFPVIELLKEKKPKEEWADCFSVSGDETILSETDYVADPYNDEERKEAINGHITEMFKGIATINYEEESLTFLSRDEIAKTILRAKKEAIEHLLEHYENNLWYIDIRQAGKYYRDNWSLFWFNNCGYTTAQFIEDTPYYAGQTFYFGNILDAHC